MLEFHNLLRLVTRLRIWGRSSESFAREWDRGGRFDWLPELSIPGRGHADFSLEGFAKGYSRFIAEKRCDLFYLDIEKIAALLGYESGVAFRKAFKREVGMP